METSHSTAKLSTLRRCIISHVWNSFIFPCTSDDPSTGFNLQTFVDKAVDGCSSPPLLVHLANSNSMPEETSLSLSPAHSFPSRLTIPSHGSQDTCSSVCVLSPQQSQTSTSSSRPVMHGSRSQVGTPISRMYVPRSVVSSSTTNVTWQVCPRDNGRYQTLSLFFFRLLVLAWVVLCYIAFGWGEAHCRGFWSGIVGRRMSVCLPIFIIREIYSM